MTDKTVCRLASYAASLEYENLTPDVVHQTKRLVIDSIGCGLGAFKSKLAKDLRELAATFTSKKNATILGSKVLSTPDMAAFVNGTMVRYLDFNDSYSGKGIAHPSDNIPVVMAAAEAYAASGCDLITGIVLAYEVQSAWEDTFCIREGGPWDQAVYATISTPLGAGKVMGLTQKQLAEALRISVVQGLSFLEARRGTISHWKACAVPNSGRNGVFAAMLAERGITGPPAIFEGSYGFFVGATRDPVTLEILAREQQNNLYFRIMKSSLKRFPSGFFSQTAIDGALEARRVLGIENGHQVRSVKIQTFKHAIHAMADNKTRWRPKTRETADHSIPYVVACALHFGSVEITHFAKKILNNPELLDLMDKVKVELNRECDMAWPDAILNIVTVTTIDGRSHTARISHYYGHYKRPMSDKDIEKKFRHLCYGLLTLQQQDAALEALWHLDEIDDLSEVLRLLVTEASRAR